MSRQPVVLTFDNIMYNIRYSQSCYDNESKLCSVLLKATVEWDLLFINKDNRQLAPQQFKVRYNKKVYEVESADYTLEDKTLIITFLCDVRINKALVDTLMIHYNYNYFKNNEVNWSIPDYLNAQWNNINDDDEDED
ncbi:hypothetical protein ManeNPV_00113 [Malacosoma neustria nucleopolyhedrovirus]|uniref:hypothetical protein n=1 Tax=Malacosoma neustria nuclear polyhedrosis virus TaxID=38012 RepID=UPI000E35F06C|nr:hypothetical protein ManeNPV_00113 [Malacosoma neustria nucleopolyhedrovirus]AUF81639.1 hypothetical protein ManeNPV_00113 [Malacosoma neustria nucleopolyhedrovirus]